jgi:predicted amidohydrolase YtcJ
MTLLRNARPVALVAGDGPELVDVRVLDGIVAAVGVGLTPEGGEEVHDAAGRWLMPGLWDAHVHFGQWARSRERLDLSGATGPQDVTRAVGEHLARTGDDVVIGYGYRSAAWRRQPTVAELDAVTAGAAVVLVSGDGHNGWLNSAGARRFGLEPTDGALVEDAWFAVLSRLEQVLPAADPERSYESALRTAAAKGIVGFVDFEWERGPAAWRRRAAEGGAPLRVRAATYVDGLDAVLSDGLRDGTPLGDPLVTMGPLKVIFDGSLNTATAFCCEPYARPGATPTRGVLNLSPDELAEIVGRAHAGGLRAAVHAIGDAAVRHALDAFASTGARGTIEHAQLVAPDDMPRFARLGVAASVQPAHLLDDRDVTDALWADRHLGCFPLRSLAAAGAELRMGSDAPVAALDPWLALAAAVHRSGDDRPPWNARESLSAREALSASTDGHTAVRPGAPADLVLLDHDPLEPREGPLARPSPRQPHTCVRSASLPPSSPVAPCTSPSDTGTASAALRVRSTTCGARVELRGLEPVSPTLPVLDARQGPLTP